MSLAFLILATLAVISALLATRLHNLVYAVLSLMIFFTSLAGLFILLTAEFIGAVQVLVYVGAVGILLLFAIMLTRHVTGATTERIDARGWIWALPAAGAVLVGLLLPAILSTPMSATAPPAFEPSVLLIGEALMSPYSPALEVVALLLTAAMIAAVAIAMSPADEKNEGPLARPPA